MSVLCMVLLSFTLPTDDMDGGSLQDEGIDTGFLYATSRVYDYYGPVLNYYDSPGSRAVSQCCCCCTVHAVSCLRCFVCGHCAFVVYLYYAYTSAFPPWLQTCVLLRAVSIIIFDFASTLRFD